MGAEGALTIVLRSLDHAGSRAETGWAVLTSHRLTFRAVQLVRTGTIHRHSRTVDQLRFETTT